MFDIRLFCALYISRSTAIHHSLQICISEQVDLSRSSELTEKVHDVPHGSVLWPILCSPHIKHVLDTIQRYFGILYHPYTDYAQL